MPSPSLNNCAAHSLIRSSGRHRRRAHDFTRQCVLTFPVLLLLLLQKSLKSLQTHAQEFLWQLADGAAPPKLSGGALAALVLAAGGAVVAIILAGRSDNNDLNFGGTVTVVSPTR